MNLEILIKNKRIVVVAAIITVFLVTGFYLSNSKNADASTETIKEVTVRKDTLKVDMVSDGKAEVSTVNLRFEANGIVGEIPVFLGQELKAGDVIARLVPDKYQYEFDTAKAGYQSALAKLQKAREQYESQILSEELKVAGLEEELAKEQMQYEAMIKVKEAFTEQEVELKRITLENVKKSYEAAIKAYERTKNSLSDIEQERAAVDQALASLKKAEINLDSTVLKSPVDGKLVYLSGNIGESVSTSADFAKVAEKGGLYVTAGVLELDIGKVFKGQESEVVFEAFPDDVYTGKVEDIEYLPVTDPSGIIAYNVKVSLDNPDDRIRSGMTCTVSFIVKQKKDVLVIPNEAVKRVNGEQVVEVKKGEGETEVRKIKTGFTDGRNSEVLEGLNQGDRVLIRQKAVR
ncbi:MAG: hypothetical protein HPY66_0720 [Firmicutes bacterium]|nr:hypothetical protein [Bacillota bacterium]